MKKRDLRKSVTPSRVRSLRRLGPRKDYRAGLLQAGVRAGPMKCDFTLFSGFLCSKSCSFGKAFEFGITFSSGRDSMSVRILQQFGEARWSSFLLA